MNLRPTLFLAGFLALLLGAPVYAQDTTPDTGPEPLPEDIAAEFDRELHEISVLKGTVDVLEVRAARNEGVMADLLSTRRDREWTAMFETTVNLAQQVSAQRQLNRDVSAYWDPLISELSVLPGEVEGALQSVRDRLTFPSRDMEIREFAVADQRFFREVQEQGRLFAAMIAYVGIADDFGLDASQEHEYIVSEVSDNAANLSEFLLIAEDDVDTLRVASMTLPNDTELAEWLSTANTRIQMTADAMQVAVEMMIELGLETELYRRQLLTATGEITADVLDVGLVAGLVREWTRTTTELVSNEGPRVIFRLLLVVLIVFVFIQVGKLVQNLTDRALRSSRVRMSHLLRRMIVSTVRNVFILIGLLLAISQLGVSLGPLLAGLGIVGFVIGFALQDTLSNFASGVMILLYRPFDVGDVVEAGGVQGRVNHMSLVNTTFLTLDNQRLIVPNNMIWASVITNITAQTTRRIDLMFGISYNDDIEKAEKILNDIIESNEAVLEDPEPVVRVHELGESSVNFVVRPWVKTHVYWETYWEITKAVKLRFDDEGISIPFPQRDVHVIKQ